MENETITLVDIENIKQLQEIVRMLSDFDERAGRVNHFDPSEKTQHYMRKAVAMADPESVIFNVTPQGNHLFLIQAEIRLAPTEAGVNYLQTIWVHEDGIQQERESQSDPEHPVHKIVGLTDLMRLERQVQYLP